ncbi:hypothetical protein MUS1_07420 [Marinomonas ushuaiensis DSM 15871]|uniref:Zinc resistance-associated protein n=1 Tax=Marinomonas ushuaiensis DSM 15871 TaxID=1122207 RepID=X7E7B8_9GAMM|nr:Spy/CpxP family protein refolding chaperone [Marinomonas ushuaiensis]ETX11765.1 hypothetical protein MUS1_07420 [Marinomonas ushuaiensis DSM 15871]
MLYRKKAGMLGVIGLSAAIVTGVAVNAFADDEPALADSKQAQRSPAVKAEAPSHEQLADRLSQELSLNDKTRDKVSDLFEKDSETIRNIQEQLHSTQVELSSLSPSSKGYLKKVSGLAEESGDLTKELTIAYAENRSELYALLTPAQISKLEMVDKPQQ